MGQKMEFYEQKSMFRYFQQTIEVERDRIGPEVCALSLLLELEL